MILSPEKKNMPIEDSDEEKYCYYNEDEETDAEELNQIISQLEESGIDLSALFDKSWK
jgi:hypothetical protein